MALFHVQCNPSIAFCFFCIILLSIRLVIRPAGMILNVLQDLALRGNRIGQYAHHPGHESHHDQGAGQDQGLDVAGGVAAEEEYQEPDPEDHADGEGNAAQDCEERQGLIQHIGSEDRQDGFLDISAHAVEKP